MRRLILAAVAIAATVSGSGCLEGKDPLVARAGKHEIRASDFIEQYRGISPQYRPDLSTAPMREKFLQTMVQKDLLVDEARARGVDNDIAVRLQIEDARKRVLIPAFFKDLFAAKPEPPAEELSALATSLSNRYHLHVLMSTDRSKVDEAHAALQTSKKSWREIEKGWAWDPPGVTSGDKGMLALDGFPSALRSEMIQLTPGSYSGVVEYGGVNHLIYLEAVEKDPSIDPAAAAQRARALWDRDWQEKTVRDLIDGAKTRRGFKLPDSALLAVTGRFAVAESTAAWPTFTDEQRRADLASWDGGHITLGDFIGRFEAVPVASRPRLSNLAETRAMLIAIVDDEIVLNEAEAAGLSARPDLARQLQRSEEQILLQKIGSELTKDVSPTDEELKKTYEENQSRLKVSAEQHLNAIVVPDSAEAHEIYVDLRKGADFAKLAKQRSKHESASSGGDIGWVGLESKPELLPLLKNAAIFRPLPPARALGGWAVLRVIETRGTRQASLDEVREYVTTLAKPAATDRMVNQWVQEKMKTAAKLYPKRLARVTIPADLLPSAGGGVAADSAGAAAGGQDHDHGGH
jgi:peptidyl-prolyl cis-trans isomerase C